ncbi:TPA: DUF551 domain-containing protein, partial [Serratia fonticola]
MDKQDIQNWNGEGLPPVGIDVEYKFIAVTYRADFSVGKVIAIGGEYAFMRHKSSGNEFIQPNSPELPDGWIPCAERMPEPETPVLIMLNGTIRKGAIFWEHPTFEEGGQPFKYWDDPDNDGQDWEVFDVTHWQPLP